MNLKNLFHRLPVAVVAKRYPLSLFDIGSRGGFIDDLHPIAIAVEAVGFEPDPVAFKLLQNSSPDPWKSVKHLSKGISGQTGRQTLYIPRDPQSASLLIHDTAIGEKFDKLQFFEVDRIEDIQTLSLTDALTEAGLNSIDYLKIDIEGAELSVFESSSEVISDVLAVKTEVSFIPFRKDQPLAGDIDQFLRQRGFELMDIIEPAHWRRQGYLIHPYYSSETPPYSKAQIVQADQLYFRDPESLYDDVERLLKLSLIAMSLGFFDHALMIMERPEVTDHLRSEFGKSPRDFVVPASKIYGRKIFFHAVYRQFRDLVPFIRYLKNFVR